VMSAGRTHSVLWSWTVRLWWMATPPEVEGAEDSEGLTCIVVARNDSHSAAVRCVVPT
jgi:hypothetical protein